MADGFLTVSDGTFTLTETEVKNQFYFYRNDEGILGDINDIGHEPMELYQVYIMQKMITGEFKGTLAGNILYELSDDEKCLRLTVSEISENESDFKDSNVTTKPQPNFFEKLKKKIFG